MSFDCKKTVADDITFKLGDLGGLHQVSWVRQDFGTAEHNTTFKIDICNFLKLKGQEEKDGCGQGTHSEHLFDRKQLRLATNKLAVCGIETFRKESESPVVEGAFPVVRNWEHERTEYDPKVTRLSNVDSKKEGLRLEVGGGSKSKRPQKAVIDFICKKDNKEEPTAQKRESEDGDSGDDDEPSKPEWDAARKADDGVGGELEFSSYGQEGAVKEDILRLNWRTPYGCEDAASSGKNSSSGGWGFFSWFFFIIFMGLLAYIVFTAWINYTQHGARGWDLLPHSDTIRDVPYIIGDWGRKIVSTLSGGGSRGGYSAV